MIDEFTATMEMSSKFWKTIKEGNEIGIFLPLLISNLSIKWCN